MSEIKVAINEQLQQLQMLMHRSMFNHFGKMHNPHRGQGRILAILKLKPEISQKELTYLLNMSKQAIAELIMKLEKNGLVTREPSEDDKRMMTIKLTEKGMKAADDVDDTTLESTKFLDCLNEDELVTFSEYLERIINYYEGQFPDEDFKQRRQMMLDFMSAHGHGFEHFKHDGHGFGRYKHHFGHGFGGHGHQNCRGFRGHESNPAVTKDSPSQNGKIKNDEDYE